MDVRLIKAMVIGDGCLNLHKRYRNVRFLCTHSIAQKEYLLWKRDLLAAGGLSCGYCEFENVTNPHTGKIGRMCRIESAVSPVLTVLKERMYPKSSGFADGILDDLDAMHLAIIFMDDGSAARQRKVSWLKDGVRSRVPCIPYIAQFRFSLQSHGQTGCEQFSSWLRRRFGIHSKVWAQGDGYAVVVYRNEDKELLRDIMSPFIHPSLDYKIKGSVHAVAYHRERLSEGAPERVVRQSDLAGNEPQEMGPKSPVRQS
jgi:hypothetical protein